MTKLPLLLPVMLYLSASLTASSVRLASAQAASSATPAVPVMECHTPEPAVSSVAKLSPDALPDAPSPAANSQARSGQPSSTPPQQGTSAPPPARPLQSRPRQSPNDAAEALRIGKLAKINGEPYDQPSIHDTILGYVKDTYGLNGAFATAARTFYAEARGKPEPWNFGQRLGSAAAITVINGNVRLGMELIFREDLRYLPCDGCKAKRKIENALLAEVTARHDEDGHRFFTLTPVVADFSGPLIAHEFWYPGSSQGLLPGFVSARAVFAARLGLHVLQEFFLDPVDKAKKANKAAAKVSHTSSAAAPPA